MCNDYSFTLNSAHGWQWELSVKTLRSPFAAEFLMRYVLIGIYIRQRRALPRYRSEEMKILNITFPRVGIEPTTSRVYSHTLVPLRHDWPH